MAAKWNPIIARGWLAIARINPHGRPAEEFTHTVNLGRGYLAEHDPAWLSAYDAGTLTENELLDAMGCGRPVQIEKRAPKPREGFFLTAHPVSTAQDEPPNPVDERAARFASLGLTIRTEYRHDVRRPTPIGREQLFETRSGRRDHGISRWPTGESIFDSNFEE